MLKQKTELQRKKIKYAREQRARQVQIHMGQLPLFDVTK